MNWPFAIAGAIAVTVAVVHSVLGERWVFRRMRQSGAIPTNGGHVLREPHVRILWASWHIVSVFGLALAACLFYLAAADLPRSVVNFLGTAVVVSMLAGSLLVLVGTKGKHAGWLGLLLVAAFSAWGLKSPYRQVAGAAPRSQQSDGFRSSRLGSIATALYIACSRANLAFFWPSTLSPNGTSTEHDHAIRLV